MSNYSDDPAMVRVDFFSPSGKWYETEAVKWTGAWKGSLNDGGQLIHAAFAQSLRDHFVGRPDRLSSMDAVCLEPYHENAHPIQLKAGTWRERK